MMPHNDCCQHGCWLTRLAEQFSTMPMPKFLIGDLVRLPFTDEFGVFSCDQGTVVGLFWSPPDYEPGWWYRVKVHQNETLTFVHLPYFEELPEQELEPDL